MKTTPRSRLLLIELVCDLFIFALCAAVCVTLLIRARAMSAESAQLTQAVYLAQAQAESLRANRDPAEELVLPEGFELTTAARDSGQSGLYAATITVSKEGSVLYTLDITFPRR